MITMVWTHGLKDKEPYLDKIYSSTDNRYISLWANGEIGSMVDVLDDHVLRFVDYYYKPGHGDEDDILQNNYPTKDDELECPVVAEGVIVYWLQHRGDKGTAEVFDKYLNSQKKRYVTLHQNDPDAWERNLVEEFVTQKHIHEELKRIERTEQTIKAYVDEDTLSTICTFAESYLRFVRRKAKLLFPPKYPENRKIEDEFLATFHSTATDCMRWIRDEYDIPYVRPFDPESRKAKKDNPQTEGELAWKRFHDIEEPRYIRWGFEDYNNEVLYYSNGGLLEEIENNLRSYKDKEEQIRYVVSLLMPFRDFADAFHPLNRIRQSERQIEKLTEDLEFWSKVEKDAVSSDSGKPLNPDKQIEACQKMLEHRHQDIEYWHEVERKFFKLIEEAFDKKYANDSMEYYLCVFFDDMISFAGRLAALLLTFHIKLPDIQERCGIYLMWHYDLTDYQDGKYVPDYGYAQKLLEEIDKEKADAKEAVHHQQAMAKTAFPGRKGRPAAKNFEAYLKADAPQGLMDILGDMLSDKKGKDAARIIIAITGLWIDEPATESVCERFPNIKSSAFNEAKNKHYGTNKYYGAAEPFREEELETIRKEIRQRLQRLNEGKAV